MLFTLQALIMIKVYLCINIFNLTFKAENLVIKRPLILVRLLKLFLKLITNLFGLKKERVKSLGILLERLLGITELSLLVVDHGLELLYLLLLV